MRRMGTSLTWIDKLPWYGGVFAREGVVHMEGDEGACLGLEPIDLGEQVWATAGGLGGAGLGPEKSRGSRAQVVNPHDAVCDALCQGRCPGCSDG